MDFDAGLILVLGCMGTFIGAVAWAEVHSRRQKRRAVHGGSSPENASPQPSLSIPPRDEA